MDRHKNSVVSFVLLAALLIPGLADLASAGSPARTVTEPNVISVFEGERILMRYRYGDVPYKPCVDRLFSPGGVQILLDAPHDHLHHHALMYAITVNGVNFWEEHNAPGRQALRSIDTSTDSRGDAPSAGISQQLDWVNPRTGELLLKEQRTIRACSPAGFRATLLMWQSKLAPAKAGKSVTLTGSHYQGLGLRFVRSMDANGEFRNADGKPGKVYRGDERLVRSRWCAYTAKVDGKEVTVAMFDHPDNERTRPFAYLSATQALHEQPLKVNSGKPLELNYAVALWDGKTDTEQIEKLYKSWTALPRKKAGTSRSQQRKSR